MKRYLIFFRDDIIKHIGKLPLHIILHYLWLWCSSAFFVFNANYVYEKRKHKYIIAFLDKHYGNFVPNGDLSISSEKVIQDLPIWVFWYQGESSMPELIKLCYSSICKHSNGRKVILLTKDNLSSYLSMPSYIIDKVKNGNISFTHLSDLVRVSLLYEYGGTWMDATLFVNGPIDNKNMNGIFGTIKIHPLSKGTISDYRWASFYLFSQPHSQAMKCFRDVMFAFWEENNTMLDYFFIDYTFELLYQKNLSFKKIVDENSYSNQHIYSLNTYMGNDLKGILSNEWAETFIFKLNRKNLKILGRLRKYGN